MSSVGHGLHSNPPLDSHWIPIFLGPEHLSGLPRANSAFRQFSGRAALRENLSWPAQRNSKAEKKDHVT